MKRYVLFFLLLSSCAAIPTVPDVNVNENFAHEEIQKIAVLMFETSWDDSDKSVLNFSKTIVVPDAGAVLANITALELTRWGRYFVLDRKDLDKKLKLMNIREEDVLNESNYLSLGKSLNVDAVVVGEIERFDASYKKLFGKFTSALQSNVSFIARCLDVTTNEVVWSMRIDGTSNKVNERALASALVAEAVKTLKKEIQ